MAPRIDGLNQNREIFKPKVIEPKVQTRQTLENRFTNETDKNLFLQQNNLGAETLKLSILAKFSPDIRPAEPPPPPTSDPQKIEDAVKAIKASLSQSITDWDVTHGDLENIQKTFQGLNAEETNKVFEQLSDDDLKNWIQELNGLSGSYSVGEKQQLFNELAGKLDAKNLARLAENLDLGSEADSVRPGQKDTPDINLLADAIAKNAPDSVKAEFVKLMADKAGKHQDAGAAIAQVLTSLKNNPELLKQTLSQLGDSQLQAIVDGASRKTVVSSRGGTVTNYDPEPLADLLNAVSNLQGEGSAKQKARIFEMSASKLTEIRENATRFGIYYGQPAEDLIQKGLTKIMDGDTTGVVRELEQNKNSFNGAGLTTYLKSMINSGNNDQVGKFIDRLMRGNDLSGNAYQRFGEADGNIHQNAQSLGYFAGAIAASVKQITGDRTKQADLIKNVFSSIAGGVGAINPTTGVTAAAANGLTTQMINDTVDALNKGTIDAGRALQNLTYPTNPETGKPYGANPNEKEQPETVYKNNFSWVYNNNSN